MRFVFMILCNEIKIKCLLASPDNYCMMEVLKEVYCSKIQIDYFSISAWKKVLLSLFISMCTFSNTHLNFTDHSQTCYVIKQCFLKYTVVLLILMYFAERNILREKNSKALQVNIRDGPIPLSQAIPIQWYRYHSFNGYFLPIPILDSSLG